MNKATFKQLGYIRVLANNLRDSKMMIRALSRDITKDEADQYIKLHTGQRV